MPKYRVEVYKEVGSRVKSGLLFGQIEEPVKRGHRVWVEEVESAFDAMDKAEAMIRDRYPNEDPQEWSIIVT